MILVVDIGNTNIKVGIFEKGGTLLDSMRLASSASKTSDEYWFLLKDLFIKRSINPKEDFEGVIMSSVNPNLNYTIEHMVEYHMGLKPKIVGSGIKCGLNIKYDNPKEVGADRIVGSFAAFNIYGAPCIVVDCGTATTFNAVSEKGEFLGGPISFGLKTTADALSVSAAKLPKIELAFPDKSINKNTIQNMQAGMLFGYVGMIDYILQKMKKEFKGARVIGTGGISSLVQKEKNLFDKVDRSLTLKGLYLIYTMNL